MTLYCSPITKNILNCNFPNRLLFLLPLEICICPARPFAQLLFLSNLSFFLPGKLLPAIWTHWFWEAFSASLRFNQVSPYFPYDNPHSSTYQHLYRSFMITFTCLTGLLNELNLALFSPPNAVKHWLISLLSGNIWGISHCFTNTWSLAFRY